MKPSKLSCASCNAERSLERHDGYQRYFIYIQNGKVKINLVAIPRFICSSCGGTHAYLPACIIPYSSYSLFFILTVLRLYYLKRFTVQRLCEKYLISISTLYHWIDVFRLHKSLWLDALNHVAMSEINFISNLQNEEGFLKLFFMKTNRSFMQTKGFTIRSRLN